MGLGQDREAPEAGLTCPSLRMARADLLYELPIVFIFLLTNIILMI